jgi:hypothetical protein
MSPTPPQALLNEQQKNSERDERRAEHGCRGLVVASR